MLDGYLGLIGRLSYGELLAAQVISEGLTGTFVFCMAVLIFDEVLLGLNHL